MFPRLSRERRLTPEKMRIILSEVKKGEIDRVAFKNEQLYQYFPRDYTAERMKQEMLQKKYRNKNKKKGET